MRGKIVILSGTRGSGKTTLCGKLIQAGRARGLDCAGVLCPARFVNGRKVGIDLIDVRSGQRRPLAIADSRPAKLRTPAYRFEDVTMEWGSSLLAAASPCTLLIVDELGPLELVHNKGWTNAIPLLGAGEYELALVIVRPELVNRFRTLIKDRPCELVKLAIGSDDQAAYDQILSLLDTGIAR